MPYSYDRTAGLKNASGSLSEASSKFRQTLQTSIRTESSSKAKATLQEAAKKFEAVIDLLKVAQHESDESIREASFDMEASIERMGLRGRNDLYTHLIRQEAIMWRQAVMEGREASIHDEVAILERRRGFNEAERRDFRRLANFFITRANDIRQSTRRSYT